MAITLGALCANTEKMYDMHLLAGRSGLDRGVRWVHEIEDTEVPDFLHGNELVFTTGIGKHKPPEWLAEFARHLCEKNAAGLVINIGPYIEAVPAELIVYCEKNGFPLFSVPWRVHIIDMMYDLCRKIISSEETELSLANAFRGLIFGTADKESCEPILERRGFHRESSYTVMTAEMRMSDEPATVRVWKQLQYTVGRTVKKSAGALGVFIQENHLTFVCRQDGVKTTDLLANDFCEKVRQLYPKIDISIGVSDLQHGLNSVAIGYREALSAMKASQFRHIEIMRYHDLGVYKLLFGVEDVHILHDFEQSVLSPITDSGRQSGSDDLKMLTCYLECNCSVNETAQRLGVHRNTVNYKMKLIRETLKIEFTEEEKVKLFLALYIRNMLGMD